MPTYTQKGPFTNGASPGIDASFLNGLESWLASMNDSHVSCDGAGKVSMSKLAIAVGTLSQIKLFSGVGSQTNVTHNCTSTPDLIIIVYNAKSGDFGSPPTTIPYAYSYTATRCNVYAQSAYNWFGLAIVF